MNIQQKQLTPEFSEGWTTRVEHKMLSVCPYAKDTLEARLWCYGWYEASRDPALISEEMGERE
jgi:ribosome modulation factor